MYKQHTLYPQGSNYIAVVNCFPKLLPEQSDFVSEADVRHSMARLAYPCQNWSPLDTICY